MKTTFIEKDRYDDPVGNWYLCTNCSRLVFIPLPNYTPSAGQEFKYCPCCGAEIVVFQKDNEE